MHNSKYKNYNIIFRNRLNWRDKLLMEQEGCKHDDLPAGFVYGLIAIVFSSLVLTILLAFYWGGKGSRLIDSVEDEKVFELISVGTYGKSAHYIIYLRNKDTDLELKQHIQHVDYLKLKDYKPGDYCVKYRKIYMTDNTVRYHFISIKPDSCGPQNINEL